MEKEILETPQPCYGKKRLFFTGNFVGVVMLLLIASTTWLYTIFALGLVLFGIIPFDAISHPYLGFDNTTYMLLYGCIYAGVMLFPLVALLFLGKRRFFPLGPAEPQSIGKSYVAILGGFGVCMLANVITEFLMQFCSWLGMPMPEFPQLLEPTLTSLALNILVIAVLPALLEEMVFRGCVLRVLRPYGDWFAVLVSAFLFGLMHGNIVQIPFALMVGIALGWLYVTTNNIWIPIAVHFFNNAASVLMEYLSFHVSEGQYLYFNGLVTYGFAIIGSFAAVMLLILFRKELHPNPPMSTVSLPARWGILLICPAMLIAIFFFMLLLILGMVVL